jgi:hypothetical protein
VVVFLSSPVYYRCERERWTDTTGGLDEEDSMKSGDSAQQPKSTNGSGANGTGTNGHAPDKCPVTGKRSFTTKLEAEQFEAENRIRFGRQYAYQCEDCPAYHLTSKPPVAFAMGETNLKRLESLTRTETSPKPSANRRGWGQTEAEVKRLWEQEFSDSEIATQIGISPAGVCHHRKKFGAANKRGESNSSQRQPKPPLTLSECDEQKRVLEEEYQSKLLKLEHHKQRLEEATRLTVSECAEGESLFIKFGHNEHLVIPKNKVPELTDSLMRWV